LLLVHGGTATSQSWASHLPAFAEHFRVFAPDSRGHGRTDNPTGELGYRVMADDVAALVDALGLRRPLVLGYSDKTMTLPKTVSREELSVIAGNGRTDRFVRCLGGRRDDA
jgi:hypothetical protein